MISKKVFSVILALALMVTLAGCGTTESQKAEDKLNTMGRYMETMISFTEEPGMVRGMTLMEDGSLAILDASFGKYCSKDAGETWRQENIPWLKELNKTAYIQDAVMSVDGYIAVKYKMTDSTTDSDTMEEANSTLEESKPIDWSYKLVNPEGTEMIFGEGIGEIDYFCFSNKGDFYASAKDNVFYKINKETGAAEKLLFLENEGCYLTVYNSILTAVNYQGIRVYDLDKNEKIEDEVLSEFFTETVGKFDFYAGNYYSALVMQSKNNILYIACRDGLFKHEIGGDAMEQIMDGDLNSFSNLSLSFLGITELKNDTFIVLFSEGKAAKYQYDADMPAILENQLKVYSLFKNDSLQQAVTLFQQKHPEIYIKYEVGKGETSSITKEDAVKNLNTQIMSGEGPDVVMLDNLPINAYIEKGILSDLTPYLSELEQTEGLMPKMKEAYNKESQILAIPSKFIVPVIVGEQEAIKDINNLKTLAEAVEALRIQNPNGQILGFRLPMEAMVKLSIISSSSWQKKDGSINEEAITEFLTQAKRIYEADIEGITQADISRNIEMYEEAYTGERLEDASYAALGGIGLASGDHLMDIGYMKGNAFSMAAISSAIEALPASNLTLKALTVENQNIYIPLYNMGILKSSANQELAGELIQTILSNENQNLTYGGFPINQKAFDNCFINTITKDPNERIMGEISAYSREGKAVMLTVEWPLQPFIDQYRGIAEKSDTPSLVDTILKDAVFEIGARAINGEKTVDQAVKEIIAKLSIYMAE